MSRVFKYDLGTAEEPGPVRIYITGKLKPMAVQLQYSHATVWVQASGRLFDHREYTFYKVTTGAEIPDGAKYCGTVQYLDGTYVEHIFMLDTTEEARKSNDPDRDAGLKAVRV